jgi:type I restriction enzyme S subunit
LKEKLIEEKKRQKKALMQQLLMGKKRLPGFDKEWNNVPFKDCIFEVDNRSTEVNQHPILSVTKDGIVYQANHFNKQIASDNNIGYKIIKRNQLAFSILNLWMGSVDVLTLCDVGIVSPAYKVFECSEKNLIPSFAKYFLRSYNVVWLYNINSETGASVVRKNLDLTALLNEKLELPPTEEQEAIAEILSTADKEIEILQKDLDQEKQKKKALMQLLLTGIVRV